MTESRHPLTCFLLSVQNKMSQFAQKRPRLTLWLLCLLLGVISWAAYSNSFRGGMVLDNAIVLQMDKRLQPTTATDMIPNPLKDKIPGDTVGISYAMDQQNIFQWPSSNGTDLSKYGKFGSLLGIIKEPYRPNIVRMFTENYWWPSFPTDLYRPLTTFSYFFNYTILGSKTDLFSYHVVNWALHWINACLALLICGALWPRRYGLSFFAAAIFALHPVAVESVTNIVGRADLLSTLSILLGGYIYIRMTRLADGQLEGTRARRRRAVKWGVLAVCFIAVSLLGVLTKESAVMLLGFVLLYDFFFRFFKLPMPAHTRFKPGRFARVAILDAFLVFLAILLVRWALNYGLQTEENLRLVELFGADWAYYRHFTVFLQVSALLGAVLLVILSLCVLFRNLEGEGLSKQAVIDTIKQAFARFVLKGAALMLPAIFLVFYAKKVILSASPFYGQIFIDNPIVGADCFDGLMTAVKVLGRYLGLLVYPATLSCDYSFNQIPLFGDHTARFWDNGQAWLSLVIIVALLVAALRFVKRNPVFGFGVFWFFVMILTTSNVFFPIGSIMAERFLYLPLFGFALVAALAVVALARGVDCLWTRETGTPGFCVYVLPALVLALLGVRSYVRNFDWRDDISLWRSAVEACPRSFKVHKGYAGALRIENMPPPMPPETVDELDLLDVQFLNSARKAAGEPFLLPGDALKEAEIARVMSWRNLPMPEGGYKPTETEIYFIDADRAKTGRKPYAEDPVLDDSDKNIRALWASVVSERGLDKSLARVEEGIRVLDSGDLPDSKQDNTLFYDAGLYYNTKAKVLEDRGDVQEALRYYQRAYEILWRGVRVDMHVNRASKEAMRARGMPEVDIIDVGNPKIRTQFIVASLRLGRVQEAYDSALVNRYMMPQDPEVNYVMGVVLREMGKPDESRALFLEAILLHSTYPQAWSELAAAYAKLPEAKNAILDDGKGSPALNVDNPIAAKDLRNAFIDLENILWESKRYDEAKQLRTQIAPTYGQPASIFPLRDSTLRTGKVARSGRAIGEESTE